MDLSGYTHREVDFFYLMKQQIFFFEKREFFDQEIVK